MRYKLPTDRLINQLVPYYLSGRRYILLLQSLAYPLKSLNDKFVTFAKLKQIEASMTSQVFYFEWYLNYKFQKYFADQSEKIFITESSPVGVDIYHESALDGKPFTVWREGEQITTSNSLEEPREFYSTAEEILINKVSFKVNVPAITITTQEFVYLLSYEVNRYKIAGKTYLIKIDSEELSPNQNV